MNKMWVTRDEDTGRILSTHERQDQAVAEAEALCRLAVRSGLKRLVGVYVEGNSWAWCYRSSQAALINA